MVHFKKVFSQPILNEIGMWLSASQARVTLNTRCTGPRMLRSSLGPRSTILRSSTISSCARLLCSRPYALMVTVNVSPEKKDEFLAIMATDAVGTRNEAENLRFDLLADEQDSSKFYLYSVYKSKQGLDAHRKTPHYKAWNDFRASGGVVSQEASKAYAIEWTG